MTRCWGRKLVLELLGFQVIPKFPFRHVTVLPRKVCRIRVPASYWPPVRQLSRGNDFQSLPSRFWSEPVTWERDLHSPLPNYPQGLCFPTNTLSTIELHFCHWICPACPHGPEGWNEFEPQCWTNKLKSEFNWRRSQYSRHWSIWKNGFGCPLGACVGGRSGGGDKPRSCYIVCTMENLSFQILIFHVFKKMKSACWWLKLLSRLKTESTRASFSLPDQVTC